MRRTIRQLAAVKPSRYLEAGAPTGLTGLFTHEAPRSTLLYLYSSTLDKLKEFPESSLYRQSTEAITNHRMGIISAVIPPGFEEWSAKASQKIADHPEVFTTTKGGVPHDGGKHTLETKNGQTFVSTKVEKGLDDLIDEWDGEQDLGPQLEGTRSTADRKGQKSIGKARPGQDSKQISWDPEPPLTAEQYVPSTAWRMECDWSNNFQNR